MNLFQRLRDALGLGDAYDEYYYSDEETEPLDPNAYPDEGDPSSRRKALPSNVIGMPGLMMEVILMQPRSFAEIPDAVIALRERKAVILNLNLMEGDEAQRCADYVAGGAFAIDGHQRQLGDSVFLFTPNFVHISNHKAPAPPQPSTASVPTSATPPARPYPPVYYRTSGQTSIEQSREF